MGKFVTSGAMLQCSFGAAPSSLSVTVPMRPTCSTPIATISDIMIPPFGMCTSMSNPSVASATAAAQGVLTPQPCAPVITSTWTPGSAQVKISGTPALTDNSMLVCTWGGNISITNPGNAAMATVK